MVESAVKNPVPRRNIPPEEDLLSMCQMIAVWHKLKAHWKALELYAEQVGFIRSEILPLGCLMVSQAVCVGIGKMDGRRVRGEERRKEKGEEWKLDLQYGAKGLKGLCQLVMFQCWVEILREDFALPDTAITFYFPRVLSRIETLFMAGLGYRNNVVRYYHELNNVVTPNTFLFATSKHVKFWHKGLLELVVPGLMVSAPLQVNGYWENYRGGRKLGPLVDISSLTFTELRDARWKLDTKEATELRMSEISMNYEFYWRPDPEPESTGGNEKEKEKPMYGWYTPMAWHKLPGPTGIPGDICDMGDVLAKRREKTISWWGWIVLKAPIPGLFYLDFILRCVKTLFVNIFWPINFGTKGESLGKIEAVWDSKEEEDGTVWYLVERKTETGTEWGYQPSETLGPGVWEMVKDFHYACPGEKRGHVQLGWWEEVGVVAEMLWGSYCVQCEDEKNS
ncbi:hypothetical protein BOTNAR_0476g00070 [Botryotinia narcissicola]|uniref:Uncharacterized protein n=1 Tax=Botryotinia narcissicola TaxID=278944 RepID=A0A4Z1HHF2_9HELO|nr:hypothetical protein BOTNAR_0476g00070 [Botryotinia narcissicola]